MHAAFARLTAWASAWSGSPAALAVFIALPLASLVWGWFAGWSAAWSGAAGAFTGWASLILLVLLQASQASDTAAIRAQLAELVRVNPEIDDALIHPDREACEQVVLAEDARATGADGAIR